MAGSFDPYYTWLAIPSEHQPPDFYRLLAIPPFEDNPDVIQNAADQRMAYLRTFQTGKNSAHSQRLLNEIAAARVCLLNPEKKVEYDQRLRQKREEQLAAEMEAEAAQNPAGFLFLEDVAQTPKSSRPARNRHPSRSSALSGLPVKHVVAIVASVIVGVFLLAVFLFSPSQPQGRQETTELVVDWPESEREGGTMEIDGVPVAVPALGPLSIPCKSGPRRITVCRPGFDPVEEIVSLSPSISNEFKPYWVPSLGLPDTKQKGPVQSESHLAPVKVQPAVDPASPATPAFAWSDEAKRLAGGGDGRGLVTELFFDENLTQRMRTRIDRRIDFLWGCDSPEPDLPGERFSVRWTGWLKPPRAGRYRIVTISDDAVRMYLDDRLVLDNWMSHGPMRDTFSADLTDQPHAVRIEVANRGKSGTMSLRWVRPDCPVEETVPAEVLFCNQATAQRTEVRLDSPEPKTGPATSQGRGLLAEIFLGRNFREASRVKVRTDYTLDWLWGYDSPGIGLPGDGFCIRWTGMLTAPRPGRYKIIAICDDGVRVVLDGRFLIDDWNWKWSRRIESDVDLTGQPQDFRVEYFDQMREAIVSLRWIPPGEKEESVIPASVFSHAARPVPADPPRFQPQPEEPPPLAQKFPVPGAEELKAVRLRVNDIARSSGLKGPELAQRLLSMGQRERSKPEQYVLLTEAIKTAENSHPILALEAVDTLVRAGFDVDAFDLRAKLLRGAAKRLDKTLAPSPAEVLATAERLARLTSSVAEDAQSGGHAEEALQLVNDVVVPIRAISANAEKKLRESELRAKRSTSRQSGRMYYEIVLQIRSGYDNLQPALESLSTRHDMLLSAVRGRRAFEQAQETLKTQPDDPAANLAAGCWLCFHVGDWKTGLNLLAKGSDERLKAMASQELDSPPATAEQQERLGDAWWNLGKRFPQQRAAILQRAGYWYRLAMKNDSSTLLREKLSPRLAEIYRLSSSKSRSASTRSNASEARFPFDEWVDALSRVEIPRDVVRGQWARTEDGLVVQPDTSARVVLPLAVKGSYDLEVQFTRTDGEDAVLLGLPVGDTACTVVLGGSRGMVHGIERIDNETADRNPSSNRPGTIDNDHRYRAVAQVRVQGDAVAITVNLDNQTATHWSGRIASLTADRRGAPPETASPGIGVSNSTVTFHSARIRVLQEAGASLAPSASRARSYNLTQQYGSREGDAFRDFAPSGRILRGFSVAFDQVIQGIQPIYSTNMTDVGKLHGREEGRTTTIVARTGYAVGWITLSTGELINGFRVTFVRINGYRLDPSDSYTSDWIGGHGTTEIQIGTSGQLVIGIHGTCDKNLRSLGLILADKAGDRESSGLPSNDGKTRDSPADGH